MKEYQDAELERLKTRFQAAKEWNQLTEIDLKNLRSIAAEQYQDLQRLKALLLLAADALEDLNKAAVTKWYTGLIAQLRKAAE